MLFILSVWFCVARFIDTTTDPDGDEYALEYLVLLTFLLYSRPVVDTLGTLVTVTVAAGLWLTVMTFIMMSLPRLSLKNNKQDDVVEIMNPIIVSIIEPMLLSGYWRYGVADMELTAYSALHSSVSQG